MPMELKDKDAMGSDDEEDLEKLRMAALQSLKRPAPVVSTFKKSPQGVKRRAFGRNRNGQFRIKNTNLISIPTIDDTIVNNQHNSKDTVKLVLPQDRYCNHKKDVEEKSESTSKFDRYDNSDKSDSESEYESETATESGSPAKLERANSLEALMQELENEIQGKTQPKTDATEVKKKIKKRKKKSEISPTESKETVESKTIDVTSEKIENHPVDREPNHQNFVRKRSPLNPRARLRNFPKFDRKVRNVSYQPPAYNAPPPPISYPPPPMPYNGPPMMYGPPVQYTPTPIAAPQPPPPQHPAEPRRPFYDRPLSPLALNTDDALTIARAPLSPRSAAFVLQNRDAIERRKKSPPRRSYSRSPSPRYHRSASEGRSPKFAKSRSRTPVKDERRSTPVREVRKRSPPLPVRRRSPENGTKKKMVRERLGAKKKRSRSPSPAPVAKAMKTDDEKPLDPVLEARKKKFETNEIKNKEGIIRLRPKVEETKTDGDAADADEKVETEGPPEVGGGDDPDENIDDILNAKVDDIFSDEETDEENEGRFKNSVADEKRRNVAVLPFAKLLDGNKGVKAELSANDRSVRRERLRSPLRTRDSANYNAESKSDGVKARNAGDAGRNDHKERVAARKPRVERKEKLVPPIENKKIEIKIRNPSKYETTTKYDVANKNEVKERNVEKTTRKVEVSTKKPDGDDDNELDGLEGKLALDADEDELFNQKCDSGDLRAQLSRKRAERQNRLPAPENVPSRLLQNALQGAVFKKQKKTKTESDAAPKDGKMPIHLRLGVANVEALEESRTKKPSKNKRQTDQV